MVPSNGSVAVEVTWIYSASRPEIGPPCTGKRGRLYLRAGRLLTIDLGTACRLQLLKLRVEGLPVGANTGISDGAIS